MTSIPTSVQKPAATKPHQGNTPEHRLQWKGRELGVLDYSITAALLAGAIAVDLGTSPRTEPRWTGGILFDASLEKALLAKTPSGRDRAQVTSGYLALVPQIAAIVDAAAVPLIFDRWNWRVARNMSILNIQAMSLNGLLSRSGHRFIGRERPDVTYCREDSDFSEACGRGNNSSFPSGHTSTAFVGAGLICAHHLALPLYGHPVADVGTCFLNVGFATSAGLLRVGAGRHYMTDVITGALVGFGSGFLLPSLLYYRSKPAREATNWLVLPVFSRTNVGVGFAGFY